MLLGDVVQEVGDSRQHTIDYRAWLGRGEVLSSVGFTVDSGTATVSNVTYSPDYTKVMFLLNGGTLGDRFNVIACATTSEGQVRYDHIAVGVIA